MWSAGVLGENSPQTLVDTMVYISCAAFFALRSGSEHRKLRLGNIEMVEKPGELPYLMYRECVSKKKTRRAETQKGFYCVNQEPC